MATKIDVSQLTLEPEEAIEASQFIFEKEFVNGILSQHHEINTGVQWNKQIVFAGKFADSLEAMSGCTPNEAGSLPLTEKFWTPGKFGTRYTHCADDLNILFKAFGKSASYNPDFYNNIDSEAGRLIIGFIGTMLRETLPVKVWFSDVNADDFAGGGNFTNGTNLDLYNIITGLWPQIRAEVGSGDDNYVEITQNSGASYAAQAITAQEAFDYLVAVVNASDSRLAGDPNAKLYVTRSIADRYRDYLRSNTIGAGYIDVTETGKRQLMFDGYPVEIMNRWDETIRAVQNDGTVWFQPHRILFTTPDNIPIGTLNDDDLEKVNAFYYEFGLSSIFDVIFNLDAKFLEPYMAVAAY